MMISQDIMGLLSDDTFWLWRRVLAEPAGSTVVKMSNSRLCLPFTELMIKLVLSGGRCLTVKEL